MCEDVCTMFKDEDMMTGNITQTIKYTFVSKQTAWNFHRGSDDKASLSVSWGTNEITAYSNDCAVTSKTTSRYFPHQTNASNDIIKTEEMIL